MSAGADAFDRIMAQARSYAEPATPYVCGHCAEPIAPKTVRILRAGLRYHGVCAAEMRKARVA